MNRRSEAVMNWRNRTKLKLIEYKGGKCSRCGYDKQIPSSYDFHHEDPKQKKFSISGKSWSYEKLQQEADKCVLLCKNCHSEIHWEQSQELRKHRIENFGHIPRLDDKQCICGFCFKPKYSKQIFCSVDCYKLNRETKRPSSDILAKEIANNSWVNLGKKYGVSDNAVRKWAKLYGLI